MNLRIAIGTLGCAAALAGCVDGDKKAGPSARPAPPPVPAAVAPGALLSAHEAYLDGDFVAVGERVRDVLLDTRSSDVVKQNAYELLDKAYEATKGNLPSRTVLPPGFEGLKYGVVRGMFGHTPFAQIYVYGHTRDIRHLKGVSLRRFPDEVLLDSNPKTGKDTQRLKHDKEGYDTFVVLRKVTDVPADGVFSIRLDLDDGTSPEISFVSHAQSSSATPDVLTPALSASTSDVHPIVSWVPFRSPEYQPFEARILSIYLGKEEDTKDVAWNIWMKDYGELASVKVGAERLAKITSLTPGDYSLHITCGEERMFGPVALSRDSHTVTPFHVVP